VSNAFDNVRLPRSLTESDEFKQLTADSVRAFQARLQYIGEVVDQIDAWLAKTQNNFPEFLDNLELDLSVTQNLPGDANSGHTSYLIHSSWSFEVTVAEIRHAIPGNLLQPLEAALPSIDSSLSQFNAWLEAQALGIKSAATSFSAAQSMAEALACHLALDIFVGDLLIGCYKARFNAGLLQQN
jgi:hypothetical protein